MDDREYVDGRLRAANRVPVGTGGTARSEAVLDRIGTRIMAEPVADLPSVGKRQTWTRLRFPAARRGVVLSSVIGALAVGGAAAATVALTTTDGAAGSCQTLRQATASVPYPAGDQAWQNWVLIQSLHPKLGTTLSDVCNDPTQQDIDKAPGTSGSSYVESISTYQGEVAMSGFCAWASDWLSAENSGDSATESQAAREIAGALQWPASQAADPHPLFGPSEGDDSDQSLLGWFIPAQKAVREGDSAQVASMFSFAGTGVIGGQCWPYQPAADSDNGTVLVRKPGQDANA
jgi:hypothetical protein